MRGRSTAMSGSGPNCSITQWITPMRPARWIQRVRCRAAWSRRPPPRRYRQGRDTPWPTRSSTRCTCAGSPRCHPGVPLRNCAARTRAWRMRRRCNTSSTLASPRSSCCRVHHNVPESFLVERGLTNYWGYNTIGFFAPHAAYSAAVRAGRPGGQVEEFRDMVAALHAAGLEVVLDVVFNHTAEGGRRWPDVVSSRAGQRCLLPTRAE